MSNTINCYELGKTVSIPVVENEELSVHFLFWCIAVLRSINCLEKTPKKNISSSKIIRISPELLQSFYFPIKLCFKLFLHFICFVCCGLQHLCTSFPYCTVPLPQALNALSSFPSICNSKVQHFRILSSVLLGS